MVQAEVEVAKATGKPDEAVAAILNGAVPIGWSASEPNVIAWASWVTLKLWVTVGAALQLVLPG